MTSLFSTPKIPKSVVPTPVVMPTVDDSAITEARKRRMAAVSRSSGRTSTNLSQNDSDQLGG